MKGPSGIMPAIKRLLKNSVFQHLAWWALSYYVLLRLFQLSSQVHPIDHLYTALFHLTLMAGVYVNLLWLIPRFLTTGRTWLYVLLALTNLLVVTALNQFLFDELIDHLIPGYYFISYYDFWDILKFHGIYIALTTLLKLSKEWFRLLETRKEIAELEQEKARNELKALRVQINPHFLMNSLNNLYSLALSGSKDTAGYLLKLADIFRYMLYETGEETAPLPKEIDILRKYLDLMRIRTSGETEIRMDIAGDPEGYLIAPLLLLPLAENSFKHGIKGETEGAYIRISIHLNNDVIHFRIANNKGKAGTPERPGEGGIGLANVKRRLELQYPGRHQFEVTETEKEFIVNLELTI